MISGQSFKYAFPVLTLVGKVPVDTCWENVLIDMRGIIGILAKCGDRMVNVLAINTLH